MAKKEEDEPNFLNKYRLGRLFLMYNSPDRSSLLTPAEQLFGEHAHAAYHAHHGFSFDDQARDGQGMPTEDPSRRVSEKKARESANNALRAAIPLMRGERRLTLAHVNEIKSVFDPLFGFHSPNAFNAQLRRIIEADSVPHTRELRARLYRKEKPRIIR